MTETEKPRGRCIVIDAYGNSPADLEADAMKQAREFFWKESVLTVDPNYIVTANTSVKTRPDKKWLSQVVVREVDTTAALAQQIQET